MFDLVTRLSQSEHGLVMFHMNENDKADGMLVALVVPGENPWMEIIALVTEPGLFKVVAKDGYKKMKEWGSQFNASRVFTAVTRSPNALFKFYETLGFKKVGYVLEED